jgi:hypothetical protein
MRFEEERKRATSSMVSDRSFKEMPCVGADPRHALRVLRTAFAPKIWDETELIPTGDEVGHEKDQR